MNNTRRKVTEWIATLNLTKVEKKQIRWIGVSSVLLTMLLLFMDNKPLEESVQRNTYGNGDKIENLEIEVSPTLKGQKRVEIDLEIKEQQYSHKEREEMFQNIEKELDSLVLGDNQKPEHISQPLNLITEVEPYPMEIQWIWYPQEKINQEGELQQEYIEDGDILELCASIIYGEEEVQYRKCVSLYPMKPSEEEKFLTNIQVEIDKEEITKKTVMLPQTLNGRKITWHAATSYRGIAIGVLGIGVCGLLLLKKRQDIQEVKRKHQELLIYQYPTIISNIVLYLGAGMTVKNAWINILQEAERRGNVHQGVYPMMKQTWHEIINGQSEAECYEQFGARCGTRGYQRMGLLLSQNLKRGTKGLLEQLEKESIEVFEERKNRAKQQGEQASTKLLLPMSMMLIVVLIMVIIPAFLTIEL